MSTTVAELSARDLSILEFEQLRWKYVAIKETAVRELFGLSLVRYTQVLNAILDQPGAELYDPVSVRRMRRLRDARRRARDARRYGFSVTG